MNRALVSLVIGLALAFAPGRAAANVGRPTWGGSLTGEPSGIRDIAIAREQLVLDLRPVAARELARISATYQLDNRGAAATLALVFASGEGGVTGFTVTLDGGPSAISEIRPLDGPLPPSWRAPATTPVPDGRDQAYDLSDLGRGAQRGADGLPPDGTAFGFTLAIPPGAHTLAISYRAEPIHRHAGDPTLLHQLAYVLAPARSWAGFGGLDVAVHVPPGWAVAIAPAMARTGDTLHGAFDRLPADAIALSFQAPATAFAVLRIAGLIVLALVGLGGGFVVAAWSCRRAIARPAVHPSLTRAAGFGLLWAAAFGATGVAAITVPAWALPGHEADYFHGYAAVFYVALVVLGALAIWPIGAVVAWWADRRVVLAVRAAELEALGASS